MSHHFPDQHTSVIHMCSAVSAGAISDVLCNPMFVVRTRLQTESLHIFVKKSSNGGSSPKQSTIIQMMKQLYSEGGILSFWRGMSANLLGLSHVAVQFPIYEQLKLCFRASREEGQETVPELLLAAGLSKMLACLLTYPHEVIRSRLMDDRTVQRIGFFKTCFRLYSAEGFAGFYVGLPVSLLRVIPNTMLTFLVYERTLYFVSRELQDRRVA
jgi:solute carrier family 25 (mitochondrial folate transporter), member 32